MADKRNRKENYNKLRAAGFSVHDANRIKGASQQKINAAIQSRSMPEKNINKITMGPTAPKTSKGYREPKPAPQHTGRQPHARTVDYMPMQELEKGYLSNYNFVVSYRLKGDPEIHYVTISSQQDMYKKDVLAQAAEYIEATPSPTKKSGAGPGQLIISSMNVEYCAVNNEGI